jgi:uncharacterized membrane protein
VWGATVTAVLAALFVVTSRSPSDEAGTIVEQRTLSNDVRSVENAVAAGAANSVEARVISAAEQSPAPRKFERRVMFDCNGDQFFVRIGDDEVRLLPPGSLTGYFIPLAPTGGSTWRGRYANEDIVFRNGGDAGAVQVGAHYFDNCVATRDRASLVEANTGVTFQAFGHSPAWNFEIVVPDGFVLTTPRGEQHVVPFREPIDGGGKITFRSVLGTQEMVAVIDRIPCLDVPTGETFANAVTATFGGEWYYGCGRFISYR